MLYRLDCQVCHGSGLTRRLTACPACEGDGERRVASQPNRLVLGTNHVAVLVMERSVGR